MVREHHDSRPVCQCVVDRLVCHGRSKHNIRRLSLLLHLQGAGGRLQPNIRGRSSTEEFGHRLTGPNKASAKEIATIKAGMNESFTTENLIACFRRSRDGVWLKRSATEVKCKALSAILRIGYCVLQELTLLYIYWKKSNFTASLTICNAKLHFENIYI